jgi:hypothetical protein
MYLIEVPTFTSLTPSHRYHHLHCNHASPYGWLAGGRAGGLYGAIGWLAGWQPFIFAKLTGSRLLNTCSRYL